MKKLLLFAQLDRASEIIGNGAVAWFTVGVISPLFSRPQNVSDLLVPLISSLFMTCLFFFVSLKLLKGARYD